MSCHRYFNIVNSRLHAPLSIVDAPSFRQFVESLDSRFVIPSRKHLTTTLVAQKDEQIRKKLIDVLQETQTVALTVDLWSNRQMKGFLGITCHFILNWSLKSALLECKRFKGRHTAENIAQYYEEAITTYSIQSKVICTVTDNASNIVKAVSLPGFKRQEPPTDESEDEVDDDNDLDDHGDNTTLQSEYCLESGHSPCFAHTLQLVIKDGLKEAGGITRVLAKAATIVSHVRKSQVATELLESERRLQFRNAFRWNSEVTSIKSILRVPEDKLKSIDGVPRLTAYERKTLQDMVEILQPFQEATNLVQGENVVTASVVIPCLHGLRQALDSLSTTYNSRMLIALQTSLKKRMSKYEEQEGFILATLLDPRFKLKWCQNEEQKSKSKEILLKRAQQITLPNSNQHISGSGELETEERNEDNEPPSKRKKAESSQLLSYIFNEQRSEAVSETTKTSLQVEISSYLSKPCLKENDDPLQFWGKQNADYPSLARLPACYLAIPASSGPVEKLFSISGKIFRPERCRLTDIHFQQLMNIKCNAHLL